MSVKPPQTDSMRDEGAPHKYFTAIPNTVVRGAKGRGLSVYAKWLYVYLKSVTGDGETCYRSTTTIATESGMSRGQVSAAKKELIRQGLITVKAGKNPRRNADHIQISDIWPLNMQEFCVHNMNTLHEEEHKQNTEVISSSVHNMNTEAVQCSQYELSVHNMNTSVHNMNQIRSQEEDPLKKKETPSLTTFESPPTETVQKVASPTPKKSPTHPVSRWCPADYLPTPAVRSWATEKYPDIDVDEALEAMKDCEFGKPHSDWDATLRTWIRNESKRQALHGGPLRSRSSRSMTEAELAAYLNAP